MGSAQSVQVIAVTGGGGGVGKSNVSINLSVCLAAMGRRVALLDADLGLANIDVLLGLRPERNLKMCFRSVRRYYADRLEAFVLFPLLQSQRMTMLGSMEHAGLIHAFSEITEQIDVLVIDTAAGISDSGSFVHASQEVLVVVCDEPSSITDAYGD